MKFGLFLNAQHPPGDSMAQRVKELAEQVRLARQAGFGLIAAGQHYLSAPYQMLQNMPLLARLAPEAGEMEVAAAVVLLPLQNPVDMAEQVATLDAICGGRFIFGVGLGYRDEEYAAFGTSTRERVGRLEECLEVMKHLWTEEEWSHQGTYYQVPKTKITSRPVQVPYPPIWIAANNDSAVRRAARLGHPWIMNPHATVETLERQVALYHESVEAAGHTPPSQRPLLRELYVAGSRQQALKEARPYLESKYQAYASWGQDKALPGHEDFTAPFAELARDRFLIGSPDDIAEQALRCQERLGANYLLMRMQWPGMAHKLVMEEIRLLGERVVPRFR